MKNKCKHCGEDINIRNPSGYCDHLYYPENCKECEERENVLTPDQMAERVRYDAYGGDY